jgi:hypothetical protein
MDRVFLVFLAYSKKIIIDSQKMIDSRDFNVNVNVLWHRRYGFLCFPHLSLLCRCEMVDGLPYIEKTKERSITCSIGKQHKETIAMGQWTGR